MRCETTSSMKECAPRARSTHAVHHAIVEVNIVIGVVLGEVLVARVVPLVVDAVVGLTLGLIAHVVIVVFVVAILKRIFLYGRYTLYNIFFLATFHRPFWAMNPSVSNSFHNLMFFPCSCSFLSFNLPISRLFGRDPAVFENLNSFSHLSVLFCAHLLLLAAVHQLWSHFCAVHNPSIFLHQIKNFSLPVPSSYHIVSSHVLLSPFPHIFCIYLASSCTCCPFHTSCIGTC